MQNASTRTVKLSCFSSPNRHTIGNSPGAFQLSRLLRSSQAEQAPRLGRHVGAAARDCVSCALGASCCAASSPLCSTCLLLLRLSDGRSGLGFAPCWKLGLARHRPWHPPRSVPLRPASSSPWRFQFARSGGSSTPAAPPPVPSCSVAKCLVSGPKGSASVAAASLSSANRLLEVAPQGLRCSCVLELRLVKAARAASTHMAGRPASLDDSWWPFEVAFPPAPKPLLLEYKLVPLVHIHPELTFAHRLGEWLQSLRSVASHGERFVGLLGVGRSL